MTFFFWGGGENGKLDVEAQIPFSRVIPAHATLLVVRSSICNNSSNNNIIGKNEKMKSDKEKDISHLENCLHRDSNPTLILAA